MQRPAHHYNAIGTLSAVSSCPLPAVHGPFQPLNTWERKHPLAWMIPAHCRRRACVPLPHVPAVWTNGRLPFALDVQVPRDGLHAAHQVLDFGDAVGIPDLRPQRGKEQTRILCSYDASKRLVEMRRLNFSFKKRGWHDGIRTFPTAVVCSLSLARQALPSRLQLSC